MRKFSLFVVGLAAFCCASLQADPAYSIADLGTLGGNTSTASGIGG